MPKPAYVRVHTSPRGGSRDTEFNTEAIIEMMGMAIKRYNSTVQLLLPDQPANGMATEQQNFRKLVGIARRKGKKLDTSLPNEGAIEYPPLELWRFDSANGDFSVEYSTSTDSNGGTVELLSARLTRGDSDFILKGRKIDGVWKCKATQRAPSLYARA